MISGHEILFDEIRLSSFTDKNKKMSRGEKLIKLLQSPNIWIGDTGTSADSTPSKVGMTDMVEDFSVTKMGIGKGIECAGSGKLKVKMVDK